VRVCFVYIRFKSSRQHLSTIVYEIEKENDGNHNDLNDVILVCAQRQSIQEMPSYRAFRICLSGRTIEDEDEAAEERERERMKRRGTSL
jgi:hypothetical protein